MSIDCRTRRYRDYQALSRDQIFDDLLPDRIEQHGALSGRGLEYKALPPLALEEGGRAVTLHAQDGRMRLSEGKSQAGVVAVLEEGAMAELLQDKRSTMGCMMNSLVRLERGGAGPWIGWEPVLRSLIDGRRVHEAGDVTLLTREGEALDLDRRFTLDDDRDEIGHFLEEAGFLHIEGVFREDEMEAVGADLDAALAVAEPDDGESWWAGDSTGKQMPVRILNFHERSAALRELLGDPRLTWIGELPGDGHQKPRGAEGLIKPLDIRSGLSDLPCTRTADKAVIPICAAA